MSGTDLYQKIKEILIGKDKEFKEKGKTTFKMFEKPIVYVDPSKNLIISKKALKKIKKEFYGDPENYSSVFAKHWMNDDALLAVGAFIDKLLKSDGENIIE